MNPKLKFHFLVTVVLLSKLSVSFGYSSNESNPDKKELFEIAQKQFPTEVVLKTEDPIPFSLNTLRLILTPISDD